MRAEVLGVLSWGSTVVLVSRHANIAHRSRCPARDPERLQDWVGEIGKDEPVVVFCAYGFHVGCRTAVALREGGFDATFMKGGHSAWKAIAGATRLYP